ncbi:unnamed protein product, partial [Prorocentrum cordatum]
DTSSTRPCPTRCCRLSRTTRSTRIWPARSRRRSSRWSTASTGGRSRTRTCALGPR